MINYQDIPFFSDSYVNVTKLLQEGFILDNLGFLVASNGTRYRLPSGPPPNSRQRHRVVKNPVPKIEPMPEMENEQGDWLTVTRDPQNINHSIINITSTKPPSTIISPNLKDLPWNTAVLSMIFNSFVILVNLILVLLVIYRLIKIKRKYKNHANSHNTVNHEKIINNKPSMRLNCQNSGVSKNTRFIVPIDQSQDSNEANVVSNGVLKNFRTINKTQTPFGQIETASMLSGTSLGFSSDPEDRFLFNYSDTTDSVLREGSNDGTHFKYNSFQRNSHEKNLCPRDTFPNLVLLSSVALHSAILGTGLCLVQLLSICMVFQKLDPTYERSQYSSWTSKQTNCLFANSLTSDTVICVRQYLVCIFVVVFHWIRHKKDDNERNCCSRENSSCYQSVAFMVIAHSLPWALAAASALSIALQPVFTFRNDEAKEITVNPNFFYRALDFVLNYCDQSSSTNNSNRVGIDQLIISILPLLMLIIIPSLTIVLACLVFLCVKTERCEKQKIPIGVLFISSCMSPTFTALWDVVQEYLNKDDKNDVLIARLSLVHMITDACIFAYIINNFKIHSYNPSMSFNFPKINAFEPDLFEENFAEYPPEIENLAGCIPCHINEGKFPTLLSACIAPQTIIVSPNSSDANILDQTLGIITTNMNFDNHRAMTGTLRSLNDREIWKNSSHLGDVLPVLSRDITDSHIGMSTFIESGSSETENSVAVEAVKAATAAVMAAKMKASSYAVTKTSEGNLSVNSSLNHLNHLGSFSRSNTQPDTFISKTTSLKNISKSFEEST